jgi:uncharacterized membrane protein YgcG
MDVLLRRLLRAAVRRGLAGDWTWLVIAACAYVLRRALNDEGDVVSSLRILPGEKFLISVREWDAPPFEGEGGGSRRRGRSSRKARGQGSGGDAGGSGASHADAVDDDA